MNTVIVEFRSEDGVTERFSVASNNIPMGIAKARLELSRWCRSNGKNPECYTYKRAYFSGRADSEPSISDIHHRVMAGKRVSSREMNRWVRSPKGMMTIAAMRGM